MEMALLAISPSGGMTKRHTAAMSTPQVNDAIARRDWMMVRSFAAAMSYQFYTSVQPYTPGSYTFAGIVLSQWLPLWLTWAPSA